MPTFCTAIDRIAATSIMRPSERDELREIDRSAIHLIRMMDEWSADNLTDDAARDWLGHVEPAAERLRSALKQES